MVPRRRDETVRRDTKTSKGGRKRPSVQGLLLSGFLPVYCSTDLHACIFAGDVIDESSANWLDLLFDYRQEATTGFGFCCRLSSGFLFEAVCSRCFVSLKIRMIASHLELSEPIISRISRPIYRSNRSFGLFRSRLSISDILRSRYPRVWRWIISASAVSFWLFFSR